MPREIFPRQIQPARFSNRMPWQSQDEGEDLLHAHSFSPRRWQQHVRLELP
jgi:hypothetical protein